MLVLCSLQDYFQGKFQYSSTCAGFSYFLSVVTSWKVTFYSTLLLKIRKRWLSFELLRLSKKNVIREIISNTLWEEWIQYSRWLGQPASSCAYCGYATKLRSSVSQLLKNVLEMISVEMLLFGKLLKLFLHLSTRHSRWQKYQNNSQVDKTRISLFSLCPSEQGCRGVLYRDGKNSHMFISCLSIFGFCFCHFRIIRCYRALLFHFFLVFHQPPLFVSEPRQPWSWQPFALVAAQSDSCVFCLCFLLFHRWNVCSWARITCLLANSAFVF